MILLKHVKREEAVHCLQKIVKHTLIEKELRVTDLARLIDTSSQNLSQKMKRDNFSEKEMRQIADALGLDLEIVMKEKK